jgi:hypothetical protein
VSLKKFKEITLKFLCYLMILIQLAGCSSAGGIYKSGDSEHGEFSLGRTALTILGAAAIAAAAKDGGGGGGYQDQGYAWDYLPGNGRWACRNKANGEFAYLENCDGLLKVDNWP